MTNKEIANQLKTAMDRNPGRSLLDVVNDALDYSCPSRRYTTYQLIEQFSTDEKWKPTNQEIYEALVRYNEKD